ncbi:hypothetical protein P3342_007397 [Pyrenophora teres f. teres]|nr:hypothetical protein P3342_007397 [Pyrenophora teres f. teres]
MKKLQEAGLQLDIDKCEFEQKRVKYLGYIVDSEKAFASTQKKLKPSRHGNLLRQLKAYEGL